MAMRQLFWQKVAGKITHEERIKELDRINNKQMVLITSKKEERIK